MDRSERNIYSTISLSFKAGFVKSGELQTETSVKDGTALLVIVADDASDNTKKLFRDKTSFYKVPFFVFGTKEELGHAIGKEERSSVAITDSGMANNLIGKLTAFEDGGNKE